MEPDHSSNIVSFTNKYPDTVLVSSEKAFVMMKQFFGTDYADRRIVVGEGDTLALGKHTLTFVTAPMVHWPEVMVTYDKTNGISWREHGISKSQVLKRNIRTKEGSEAINDCINEFIDINVKKSNLKNE